MQKTMEVRRDQERMMSLRTNAFVINSLVRRVGLMSYERVADGWPSSFMSNEYCIRIIFFVEQENLQS